VTTSVKYCSSARQKLKAIKDLVEAVFHPNKFYLNKENYRSHVFIRRPEESILVQTQHRNVTLRVAHLHSVIGKTFD